MTARSRPAKKRKAAQKTAPLAKRLPVPREPHELLNRLKPGQTPAEGAAGMMVEGLGMNAIAAVAFSKKIAPVDVTEAFAQTIEAVQKITAGDRGSLEAILAAQSLALNAIFTECVLLARGSIDKPEVFDRLMRYGFRAQSQCRATAETIALMQAPPTVFAKQANIAGGNQQVNNTMHGPSVSLSPARAGNSEARPIKLLEPVNDGERLDTRASQAAARSNSTVETVDALDGAAHRGRQGSGREKRVQRRTATTSANRVSKTARVARIA